MEWKEVIENLKYLISEDCTDTQFDYADEIEIAIRVMESQEDLWSKIHKAISEIESEEVEVDYMDERKGGFNSGIFRALEILKKNIGEKE